LRFKKCIFVFQRTFFCRIYVVILAIND
jgi:hypothetical protein